MELNRYKVLALRTEGESASGVIHLEKDDSRLLNAALGLAGEAGEISDTLKKFLFHGHPFDEQKFIKEVGDILWYCAQAAEALCISLDDIAERNIKKLQARYPEGFSSHNSIHKDESKE